MRAKYLFINHIRAILPLLIAAGLLGACRPAATDGNVATPTPTITPGPTPTATPEPLGSPSNPLLIGVVAAAADAPTAAQQLDQRLTARSGHATQTRFFTGYDELLAEMKAGRLHFAWLPPFTYLKARRENYADVNLLSNHFGVYQYGIQYLAHIQSRFTPYFDPIKNQNTADGATALPQLAGKRPCLVEPLSASGYIVPLGLLKEQNLTLAEPALLQSHTAVVRALYIRGICDFGATFATSGDPRTASNVLQDLPDAMEKVVILWRSEAIIPNLNLSVQAQVPDNLRQDTLAALTELVKTPEGKDLLSRATDYSIQDLRIVEDPLYDPLRRMLEYTGGELDNLIGK